MDYSFKEDKSPPDAEIRTLEYCYYVYLLTLCLSQLRGKLDKSYWLQENRIFYLRECYNKLKKEASDKGSPMYEILLNYVGNNPDKVTEAFEKLENILSDVEK